MAEHAHSIVEQKNQIDQLSKESEKLDVKIKSQQELVEVMQEELMKGLEDAKPDRPESDMLVQELEKEGGASSLSGSMSLLHKISQRQQLVTMQQ